MSHWTPPFTLAALAATLAAGCPQSSGQDAGFTGATDGSFLTIGVGAPCTINIGMGVDPCAPYGYQCDVTQYGAPGECELPEFGVSCIPSVGCATDVLALSCFTFPGIDGASYDVCATGCSSYLDCPSPQTACFGVTYNGHATGACYLNPCLTPYAGCEATYPDAGDDGTCLASGGVQLCDQNGSAPIGGPCDPQRDAGTFLCQREAVCAIGPDAGKTICIQICDGGDVCNTGTSCVAPSDTDFGLCLVPCESESTCPEGQNCREYQNPWDGGSLGTFCLLL